MYIQSKLLQCMPVTGTDVGLRWLLCPGEEKKREGNEGVIEYGMSCRIKPKRNMPHFMKEMGRNLDGPLKGKKGSYVMFWN